MGQATVVQPTTQAVVMVESIAAPVVEELTPLKLAIAHANVSPSTTIVEMAAITTDRNFPHNPNVTQVVILEEEV